MVGVGIRVEGGHFPKASASVQADGLMKRLIRLQPKSRETELACLRLQRLQHAPTNP